MPNASNTRPLTVTVAGDEESPQAEARAAMSRTTATAGRINDPLSYHRTNTPAKASQLIVSLGFGSACQDRNGANPLKIPVRGMRQSLHFQSPGRSNLACRPPV